MQHGWCWFSTWCKAASWPPLQKGSPWLKPLVSLSRPSLTSCARARWQAPLWTRNAKVSSECTDSIFFFIWLFPIWSFILRCLFFPSFIDILQGNFKPDYYLKHIQKDLRLAISMGDMANHPTPMAAAANEVHYCVFANSSLFFRCAVESDWQKQRQ